MHVFYICGAVRSAVMLAAVSMLLWRSVLFLPVYGSCFSWTILNLNTIFLFRQFQHSSTVDLYVNEFHSPRILFVSLFYGCHSLTNKDYCFILLSTPYLCRVRYGVRQRYGLLPGESSRHFVLSSSRLHTHFPHTRSSKVDLLSVQDVAQQRQNRCLVNSV